MLVEKDENRNKKRPGHFCPGLLLLSETVSYLSAFGFAGDTATFRPCIIERCMYATTFSAASLGTSTKVKLSNMLTFLIWFLGRSDFLDMAFTISTALTP